jgi:GntR family transcriptional regulator/MocR family aminotransferase
VYLELDGNGALYAQLTRALKAAILAGRVAAGARLPATRVLSREMDLSRNTVLAAYEQLHAEGFLVGKVGSGSYVAEIEAARQPRTAPRVVPTSPVARYAKRAREVFDDIIPGRQYKGLRYNLQYGLPLTNPTLTSAWRRALAQASAHAELDYPDPQGLLSLREQITDYLARRRGIVCSPEDLLVVSGTQQAFFLAATVLVEAADGVILEDPHYRGARQVFQAHGARVEAVPVDGDGLRTDALPERGARLIVVTPSHQFPAGAVMSLARRLELIEYAARQRAWVIEDDYDGEYRYIGRPLPALKSLDRDGRVLYVGTFSKMLFPGIRLGYVVVPETQVARFEQIAEIFAGGSPQISQAIVAAFIAEGHFARHIQRMRKLYAERREMTAAGLQSVLAKHMRIDSQPGGMHLILRLQSRRSDRRLVARMRADGMYAEALSEWAIGHDMPASLLLGFTNINSQGAAETLGKRIASLI